MDFECRYDNEWVRKYLVKFAEVIVKEVKKYIILFS